MIVLKYRASYQGVLTPVQGEDIDQFEVCCRPRTVMFQANMPGTTLADVAKWMRTQGLFALRSWQSEPFAEDNRAEWTVIVGPNSERGGADKIMELHNNVTGKKPVREPKPTDVQKRMARARLLEGSVKVERASGSNGRTWHIGTVESASRSGAKYNVRVEVGVDGQERKLIGSYCNCEDWGDGAPQLEVKLNGAVYDVKFCKHVGAMALHVRKQWR